MRSFRDPIHGFIRADELETALINSRPLQRLRSIHQLGFTYLIFPGAEHSRFCHALGAMDLAGRVYDVLAAKAAGGLDPHPDSRSRRLVRAAALLHDIGHAPFSHSSEELFAGGLDHEAMTHRLLQGEEIAEIMARLGDGITPRDVSGILSGAGDRRLRILSAIVAGELDVDKMDYLLRDSLYCGVRYGSYDLERLLDTMLPLQDPDSGELGIGVDEGGVHSLEALVMARYYMFTQVYFNVGGKALELHFTAWLADEGLRWPLEPEAFLRHDDVSALAAMRASSSPHARAVIERDPFPLAFETDEHLSAEEEQRFRSLLPALEDAFGRGRLLVSHSAKDPHRLRQKRLLVRRYDGRLEPMQEASHFIGHLSRIERYRIYAPPELRQQVAAEIGQRWQG